MRTSYFHCASLAAVSLAAAWGGCAQAQAATAPAADSPSSVGEVVVMAERRPTNLQTAPVAATVLGGRELAERGILSVDQLETVSPSVTIESYGQGNDFNIRGIGRNVQNLATPPGVVVYRDGVATFPGYFQSEPYYDIASLEVVRGPQGTFAGQNATGGAVFVTETNPSFAKVGGYAQAEYGNFNQAQLQGAINIPLSNTLAVRIATDNNYHDSFYNFTGPYSGHPGRLRSTSDRIGLLWQPSDPLRVLFKVDYNYIDRGGDAAAPYTTPTSRLFDISSNAHWGASDEFVRSVLDATYQFSNGVKLRSVTGYQKGKTTSEADVDGTDTLSYTFVDAFQESLFSQELTLTSPDEGRFRWIAGAYFSHDRLTIPQGGYDYGLPGGVYDIIVVGHALKRSEAVFGQVSYSLTPQLEIQAGGRYTHFRARNDVTESIPERGIILPDHQSEHDSKFTGKVALNYKLDADNFLFAFVATGHKGGGLNIPSSLALPPVFGPEDVTDYEAGWKSTLAGGHIRTQISAYYSRFTGLQVSLPNPTTPTQSLEVNSPSASKLYGVEAQVQLHYGDFSADLGGSVSHSRLGRFFAMDPRRPGPGSCAALAGPSTGYCVNVEGNEQPYAPPATFQFSARYRFRLAGDGAITPSVNFSHVSAQWASIFENASLGDRLGSRDLLGAQVAWTHRDWAVTAYASNLTDQHYVAALDGSHVFAGAPRQYGLRVTRNF